MAARVRHVKTIISALQETRRALHVQTAKRGRVPSRRARIVLLTIIRPEEVDVQNVNQILLAQRAPGSALYVLRAKDLARLRV